jgi:hypothetical protein
LESILRYDIRKVYLENLACGNAVIAAPVENLMDRQAAHRFTTGAWKSIKTLSHNHLDNSPLRYELPTLPQALLLLKNIN